MMGAKVFANGREISGKASENKSIAAMPDVCLSPPPPPAGPIPIPYPNTAMASDTADGTKTVKLGGKEAGMKNSSTYSKSSGDEPATQSQGANVGSHKIQGPMTFSAWSSDVKLEGANAVRTGDMTMHNGGPSPGVAPLTASVAGVDVHPPGTCDELKKRNRDAREEMMSEERKGIKGVGEGKTTITHATLTPPPGMGPPISLRACSRALVGKFDGGFAQGKNMGQKGGDTIVCGKPYPYPPAGIPKSSHTEARLLETIMSSVSLVPPKPTLTMAIDWHKSKTPNDPCKTCKNMLCRATECIDINLCKNGETVPLKCK